MMREIKFRGKSTETKLHTAKWRIGALLTPSNEACKPVIFQRFSKPTRDGNGYWYEVEADTVGQFTGLKDPTGKEIYEGDILECLALDDGPFVVRVVFRNGAFHTDVHDGVNGADFTCLLADFIALGDVRIVGNIWDGYPKFVSNEGIEVFEK